MQTENKEQYEHVEKLTKQLRNNELLFLYGTIDISGRWTKPKEERELKYLSDNIELIDEMVDLPYETSNMVRMIQVWSCGSWGDEEYELLFDNEQDLENWRNKVEQLCVKRGKAWDTFGDKWGKILIPYEIYTNPENINAPRCGYKAENCGDYYRLYINWNSAVPQSSIYKAENSRWAVQSIELTVMGNSLEMSIGDAITNVGTSIKFSPKLAVNTKPTVFAIGEKEYWTSPKDYHPYTGYEDNSDTCSIFSELSPFT